jgi:hypothetical protein
VAKRRAIAELPYGTNTKVFITTRGPPLAPLEAGLEEAQVLRLVDHPQPADRDRDWRPHLGDRLHGDVAVGLRVHAAREGQPHQLERGPVVLARLLVAPGGDAPRSIERMPESR